MSRLIRKRLWCAWLVASLLLVAAPGQAQPQPRPTVKQVLVLQSLERGNLPLDRFTGNLRAGLDQRVDKPVNVVEVVVGASGFVRAPDQAVIDYIRSVYAGRPAPDLVMTVGGPAAVFARRNAQQLFPTAPLLLASVDQRYLRGAALGDNESAVTVVNDFPRLVDDILRVLPETRQIFMVIGSGALGNFWRRELEPGFARHAGRLTFVWSDELTLQDIQRRVANLPKNSAIFYLTFGSDVQGGAYADAQVLADLHASANAPIFGALRPFLGHGIVGGTMISIDELSRNTADIATRILNGEPPSSLRPPPQLPGHPVFDWRELQRWDIPESRLPPGSEVRFRGPSLWSEYEAAILVSIGVLLLQSLLIGRLLYERRARHRAESESRHNLTLAADANRRETMSALTASMGHELAQPLSAVRHNADALQRMVANRKATPEETLEILADIQAGAVAAIQIFERHRVMLRGRELQKTQVDLHSVIGDSLALVAHDMRKHKIEVSLDLSQVPCVTDGDPVLLQQVFLNLVRNAIDALTEIPRTTRRITIASVIEATEVEISVCDSGTGLSPDILDTLYQPFVTTKSHGLGIGLTVTHSIVSAHGGAIVAFANPGGGATFTVTLPRATTAGS
ncbi:ATP-binding protein [uncultured Ramlibacter sp.]|uniref:sensor histidine kinase n=1 Tax=uncultured Ramlibacter sp. TaxID=260755 RepID=UPI00260A29EE|nr:ATP-binding protein [uncultured Ramlibacter sp.]